MTTGRVVSYGTPRHRCVESTTSKCGNVFTSPSVRKDKIAKRRDKLAKAEAEIVTLRAEIERLKAEIIRLKPAVQAIDPVAEALKKYEAENGGA